MNMSYCEMNNTKMDLRICLMHVDEHINRNALYSIRDSEICDFKDMVIDFYNFMIENSLLAGDTELDHN